jgi:hypothetical protein
VFNAPSTTFSERKQLLRAIVVEVVITIDPVARTAALRIIWQGGASTDLTMALTKADRHFRATDEDTVVLLRRLAKAYDDKTIALILSQPQRRTGTGLRRSGQYGSHSGYRTIVCGQAPGGLRTLVLPEWTWSSDQTRNPREI